MTQRSRAAGFTIIELLIAVVVVGILTALALPSFLDSIRKGRRSEAFAAISAAQQAQERYRSTNASYTTTLSDLGISSSTTASGYYTISLDTSSATGDTASNSYVVSAAGVDGTSQASDSQCRNLSVRVRAGTVEYAGCGSCSAYTYSQTNACWNR